MLKKAIVLTPVNKMALFNYVKSYNISYSVLRHAVSTIMWMSNLALVFPTHPKALLGLA